MISRLKRAIDWARRIHLFRRITGFLLLVRTSLPLIFMVVLSLLWSKTMGVEANRQLVDLYTYDTKVFSQHYDKVKDKIDVIYGNAEKALVGLQGIRDSLQVYLAEKDDDLSVFWSNIKQKCELTADRWNELKQVIVDEVQKYVAFVKDAIAKIKSYVFSLLDVKEQITQFLDQLKAELEPLNDVLDVINDITFGALDDLVFKFPPLPTLPSFPVIEWSRLVPNFSEISTRIQNAFQELKTDANELLSQWGAIAQGPQLELGFLDSEVLKADFIDELWSMSEVFESYWEELRKAKDRYDRKLQQRRESLRPVLRVLGVFILVWLVLWLLFYLISLRDNLVRAFRMMRGLRVDPYMNP